MSEVYLFISYNHRLAKNTGVWQKSVKVFCEKSIDHIHGTYSKQYCMFLLVVNYMLHILYIGNTYNKCMYVFMYVNVYMFFPQITVCQTFTPMPLVSLIIINVCILKNINKRKILNN